METNFIKNLTEKQLKTLILLGLLEYNNQFEEEISYGIYDIDDLKLNQTEFTTAINYEIYNSKNVHKCNFLINNYSMLLNDRGFSLDLSNVLKLYLAHEYSNEYTIYLYKKRLNDAEEENDYLLDNAHNILNEYGLSKLDTKSKTKRIGTIK